jgi:hypothetical protein
MATSRTTEITRRYANGTAIISRRDGKLRSVLYECAWSSARTGNWQINSRE